MEREQIFLLLLRDKIILCHLLGDYLRKSPSSRRLWAGCSPAELWWWPATCCSPTTRSDSPSTSAADCSFRAITWTTRHSTSIPDSSREDCKLFLAFCSYYYHHPSLRNSMKKRKEIGDNRKKVVRQLLK